MKKLSMFFILLGVLMTLPACWSCKKACQQDASCTSCTDANPTEPGKIKKVKEVGQE